MKRKELINLIAAIAVLLATVLLVYNVAFADRRAPEPAMIEVVPEIEASFDEVILSELRNGQRARNFNVPIDLSGLGNRQPFGG